MSKKNEPKRLLGNKHIYSDIFTALSNLSDTMINTLKFSYNKYVQETLSKKAPETNFIRQRENLYKFITKQLNDEKNIAEKIVRLLQQKKEKPKNKTSQERYVVDVLHVLALTIDATINKIINDTRKVPFKAFYKN